MTDDISLNESPGVVIALEHMNSVLVKGETLEAWSVQRRLFAFIHRRTLIAATSGRFIKISRGLIGGNTSEDAVTKLQQAKPMLDNKLIRDSEYESIKARLISGF